MAIGRRLLAAAVLSAMTTTVLPSYAAPPVSQSNGYAIGGYDPVAYFLVGKAERGRSEFNYRWRDATWLFSSADNRAKFIANPEAYAPNTVGSARRECRAATATTPDPKAWAIVHGKLYLSGNIEGRDRWMRDSAATIAKADQWWKRSYAGQ